MGLSPFRRLLIAGLALVGASNTGGAQGVSQLLWTPHAATDSALTQLLGEWTLRGDEVGVAAEYGLRVLRLAPEPINVFVMNRGGDGSEPIAMFTMTAGPDAGMVVVTWKDLQRDESYEMEPGRLEGSNIVFDVPTPDGLMRNVFRKTGTHAWTYTVSVRLDGTWRRAAEYVLAPIHPDGPRAAFEERPSIANLPRFRQELTLMANRIINTFDEYLGKELTLRVLVNLSSTGEVTNAEMLRGSGNPVVDRETLALIRRTQFRPGIRASVATPASVILPVRLVFPEND